MYQCPPMNESFPGNENDTLATPVSPGSNELAEKDIIRCVEEQRGRLKEMNSPTVQVTWGEGLRGIVPRQELIALLDLGLAEESMDKRRKLAMSANASGAGTVFYPFTGAFEVSEIVKEVTGV